MKKIIAHWLLAIPVIAGIAFVLPPKKIKIYMIGDSTMCNYPVRQWPVTGWGMPFANYFDSTVTIDNRARGGRSTRTFLEEKLWQPIADSLNAGDYVFIQFGHNDEAKEPQYAARYTPVPDYKTNLIRFITDTRAKNAIPILVTPVSRRNFDKDGNAKETHTDYTQAVFEVGNQYHVPVIDLDRQSREMYQKMGPSTAKLLFMELDSAEHPNYPVGRHDNTHFNEYGARKMAEIVLNDIKAQHLDLADRIVKSAGVTQANAQNKSSDYSWTNLPSAQLPVIKGDTYNIISYGAVAGPGSVNTKSILTAIDVCNSHGGGTVLIPEGDWITGPIKLKSNVNLHLQKGAILEFSKDKNLYPLVMGNFEGTKTVRNQSPISGEDLENIAITGDGIVEGNGDVWRPLNKDKQTQAQWEQKINSGGVLSDDGKTWFPSAQSKRGQEMARAGEIEKLTTIEDFMPVKDYLRPNLVVLTRCKKILLQGVTFQNSPAWCLHPLMCADLTIQRVKVNNPPWAQNGDGLDIESCRNVLVENNSFECGDDGICIKSGKDAQGRLRAMPTENVTVRNDTVYHAHGGFVIGSEMSGGAKNLFVYNCVFIGTDKGLRFKTARGRGGMVSDIYVKNIYMKNIVQEAIYFDMYYFTKPPKPGEKMPVFSVNEGTPQFRDFYISDIKCEGAQKGVFVRGLPEMSITNINLDNLDLTVSTGVEIIEAKNIHLNNINVFTAQSDPVIFIANSSNVDFRQLSVKPNSGVLFSISGERTKNITALEVKAPGINTLAKFDDHAEKSTLSVN